MVDEYNENEKAYILREFIKFVLNGKNLTATYVKVHLKKTQFRYYACH